MLRIATIVKPWKESGALNAQISLYAFWNHEVFLTKSGDLGVVLRVRGVDYESLDQAAQEYTVKRLEAALKIFGRFAAG
jgi:type IV secretory pathway VirB4 component